MAAGYETMQLMTPDQYDGLSSLGESLREQTSELLHKHGDPHQVTGRGSMFCVLLTEGQPVDFRDLLEIRTSGPDLTGLDREMLGRGVLLGSRGLFGVLSTPMGETEVDQFVAGLEGALAALGVY